MHIYFGGFFALAALIALGVALWWAYSKRLPHAQTQTQTIVGGAWFCIFLTTLIAPAPVTPGYKGTILFCLLVATLALAFYAGIPGPKSVAAAHLMIGLGVLFFAFADLSSLRLPSPFVLLAPALGALAYWCTAPARVELRPGLIAFLVLLTLASWQAIEMWAQHRTLWATAALLGMIVYWVVVACHHTAAPRGHPRPDAAQYAHYTLIALALAHWFLALSVWTAFDIT